MLEEAEEIFLGERVSIRMDANYWLLPDESLYEAADLGSELEGIREPVICDVTTNNIPDEIIFKLMNFRNYVRGNAKYKKFFRDKILIFCS